MGESERERERERERGRCALMGLEFPELIAITRFFGEAQSSSATISFVGRSFGMV